MEVRLASVVLGWDKVLATVDHLLGKALDHARATGASEAEMLDWRLAPDMFPLRDQIRFVANLVRQWAARAAATGIPADAHGECDAAGLRATVADARAFVAGLRPAQFEGRDGEPVTIDLGQIRPTMPLGQWIAGFATTNILFHTSILYAILRSRGVPLGKPDLFAGGL